jgi:hypothetical protein
VPTPMSLLQANTAAAFPNLSLFPFPNPLAPAFLTGNPCLVSVRTDQQQQASTMLACTSSWLMVITPQHIRLPSMLLQVQPATHDPPRRLCAPTAPEYDPIMKAAILASIVILAPCIISMASGARMLHTYGSNGGGQQQHQELRMHTSSSLGCC